MPVRPSPTPVRPETAGRHTVVIDALRPPDGITCARCRCARPVVEEGCPYCGEGR